MLALPKPYGYPNGLALSIKGPSELYFEIGDICGTYGCPDFVVQRIRASIKHSERYDCFVSGQVARRYDELERELAMCGATVSVEPTGAYEYAVWQKKHTSAPVMELDERAFAGCGCLACKLERSQSNTSFFDEVAPGVFVIDLGTLVFGRD